jgi:hypothetical protein
LVSGFSPAAEFARSGLKAGTKFLKKHLLFFAMRVIVGTWTGDGS